MSSVAGSISTAAGWWKAPIRFLPAAALIAVLPPTERIDLGEQAGRHLHIGAAALEDRGGEAGEVADHAAAEGDDMVAALDPELEQPRRPARSSRAQLLLASPGGTSDRRDVEPATPPAAAPCAAQTFSSATDDDPPAARMRREQLAGAVEQAGADRDRVAALAERDLDPLHRARSASASTIRSTVRSCGAGSLRMWRCASA